MKKALKFLLPILLLAASIVAAQRLIATRPVVSPSPTREQVYAVETVAVERRAARPELVAYGTVISGRSAELAAQVAGPVVAVAPSLIRGGRVDAGDVLVNIDPADYRSTLDDLDAQVRAARAQVRELEASLALERSLSEVARDRLANAERDVERLTELKRRSAASARALDEARLKQLGERQSLLARQQRIATLGAQIDSAKATIDGLAARRELAARDLERTRVTAPFAGFVADPQAEIGERVSLGQVVATVIDAERLEVSADIGQNDFPLLFDPAETVEGRAVTVHWRLGRESLDIDGIVDRQGSEIDATTGGVTIYVRLTGSPPTTLRPGAFVELVIPARRLEDVIRLPETALYDGTTVYSVVDGRLAPRPVTVAARQGDTIWVRGPLVLGEQVLTTRMTVAAPGVRVTAGGTGTGTETGTGTGTTPVMPRKDDGAES